MRAAFLTILPLVLTGGAQPPAAARLKPGLCAFTQVKTVGQRLEDGQGRPVPNSGSVAVLANGIVTISYDQVPAVLESRPGDRAMVCLVRLPRHCPPGDDRGRIYTVTNLRTERSWTLPDSQHMCGGA